MDALIAEDIANKRSAWRCGAGGSERPIVWRKSLWRSRRRACA